MPNLVDGLIKIFCNSGSVVHGSGVQGSKFRVNGKEGIEDPKSSLNMAIFQSNCKFGSKFWIGPVEDDAFLINTHSKCSPGTKMEP
jgi:hypothetical protein